MANFRTHLFVASSGSGLCASVAVAIGVPQGYFFLLTLAGAIGGILPDIDLRKPSRISGLAFCCALPLLALFELNKKYSIAELWVVWCGTYLIVSFAFCLLPIPCIKHRGIFHSILAAEFFLILTAVIFDRVFGEPPALAWLTGLFVFMGFVMHLALDEIYAVDFKTRKIKRSFGSALKMIDLKSARASALMALALGAVTLSAPPTKEFVEVVKPPVFFALLKDRLLPKGSWFGLELPAAKLPPDPGGVSEEKLVAASPIGSEGTKAKNRSRQIPRSAERQVCGRKSCGYHHQVRRR